jgi:hypothetical protein
MPAVARTPKSKKEYKDIKVLSEDDEAFVAKIFDDESPYTFSRDVNAYLYYSALTGEQGALNKFLYSLLVVETPDEATEDDVETARWELKRRFNETMETQKGLTMDRFIKFTTDLVEIAGNAPAT